MNDPEHSILYVVHSGRKNLLHSGQKRVKKGQEGRKCLRGLVLRDLSESSRSHAPIYPRTYPMTLPLILASSSPIRAQMLSQAGVAFSTQPARIDELAIRAAMLSEGATPRDLADALAEFKARKVADKRPEAMVIGCDQVLELNKAVLGKPSTMAEARDQMRALSGQVHRLLSAVVVYEAGKPVWRHVGVVQMHMRLLSDKYIDDYLDRNWHSVCHSVGAYKLEEEGVRLFSRVEGDYFTVLGLPLIDLLSYLTVKGILPT